jgi:hypothetical protein
MKYLEVQDLSQYNCLLDGFDIGTSIIYGKIEVYSCKQTSQDKKLAQELERAYQTTKQTQPIIKSEYAVKTSTSRPIVKQEGSSSRNVNTALVPSKPNSYELDKKSPQPLSPALSPPCPHDLSTNDDPFGDSKQKRKTFTDLIATLNTSYPDYDFRDVKPEDFTKETNFQQVMNSVNLYLRDVFSGEQVTRLWSIIEMVVGVTESDIYSYHPDLNQDADSDPLALGEGKIWTWNYFFYNRKQKRLLLFTCHAKSKNSVKGSRFMGRASADYDTYYSNAKNIGVHYHARGYDSFEEEEDETAELEFLTEDDDYY